MPRFSANLGFLWPGQPLLAQIDAAARAGFRAVELHWPYAVPGEEVKAACKRHNLALLGINSPVGNTGEFGLAAVPGREADFAAAMEQAIAYCLASGATAIHAMAGVVPAEQKAKGREILLRNLAAASKLVAPHGITILLEAINQRDRHGYFYSTVAEPAAVIAELGVSNIRLMFDTYHVGVAEGDILKKLEKHFPIIGHIQFAAVPSRAEPDEGEIAYGAIFKAIDTLGYTGWVGAEYKPRGDTDAGLAWTKSLGVTL